MKQVVIEFDGNNSTLFYEADLDGILKRNKWTAKWGGVAIIVPPTHTALILKDGKILGVYEEGRHELYDQQKGFWIFKMPVKDCLRAKVLYISRTVKVRMYWGTTENQTIHYVDPELGHPIWLRSYGHVEIKVADPTKFYLEIVGAGGADTREDEDAFVGNAAHVYDKEKWENRFRPKALAVISDKIREAIVSNDLSFFELDTHKTAIQQQVEPLLREIFANDYGFTLCDFLIENFNINEEDEETIIGKYKKRRARAEERYDYRENRKFEKEKEQDAREDLREEIEFKKSIRNDINDLEDDQRKRERDEIEYRRKMQLEDEDRAWEREKHIREQDANLEIEKAYHETVRAVGWPDAPKVAVKEKPEELPKAHYCTKCGRACEKDDLYCPFCGAPTKQNNLTQTCPKCGNECSVKVRYCSKCGQHLKG